MKKIKNKDTVTLDTFVKKEPIDESDSSDEKIKKRLKTETVCTFNNYLNKAMKRDDSFIDSTDEDKNLQDVKVKQELKTIEADRDVDNSEEETLKKKDKHKTDQHKQKRKKVKVKMTKDLESTNSSETEDGNQAKFYSFQGKDVCNISVCIFIFNF